MVSYFYTRMYACVDYPRLIRKSLAGIMLGVPNKLTGINAFEYQRAFVDLKDDYGT